mmetsp:Transcript_21236/g.55165  ORF Transcript_21236/g.55165 Transcript_21236/m.55165 type:complete len:360 (-) Transcript_21236:321-1400(-)
MYIATYLPNRLSPCHGLPQDRLTLRTLQVPLSLSSTRASLQALLALVFLLLHLGVRRVVRHICSQGVDALQLPHGLLTRDLRSSPQPRRTAAHSITSRYSQGLLLSLSIHTRLLPTLSLWSLLSSSSSLAHSVRRSSTTSSRSSTSSQTPTHRCTGRSSRGCRWPPCRHSSGGRAHRTLRALTADDRVVVQLGALLLLARALVRSLSPQHKTEDCLHRLLDLIPWPRGYSIHPAQLDHLAIHLLVLLLGLRGVQHTFRLMLHMTGVLLALASTGTPTCLATLVARLTVDHCSGIPMPVFHCWSSKSLSVVFALSGVVPELPCTLPSLFNSMPSLFCSMPALFSLMPSLFCLMPSRCCSS